MLKFSIITPVYNGEKFISKCIEAIASIDYDMSCIEHIIVDDGSTDGTKEICKFYARKYKHIKFFSKTNGNWGSVINYVKNNKIATGDYIVICDADDVVNSKIYSYINKRVKKTGLIPDLFVGSFYLWNGKKRKNKVWSYYFFFKKLLNKKRQMQYFSPLVLPFSTFIKNNIFYSIEDLKEKIPYQDSILLVNAYIKSKTIGLTKKPFSKYWKTRPGNTMTAVNTRSGVDRQLINLEYFSKNNLIEPFTYQLFGLKDVRKYLKENNLSYQFNKKKPDFTGFPWWARWMIKLMFLIQVKKFIKKSKD